MLVTYSHLLNTSVLSVQTGSPVGYLAGAVIDPDTLKTLAFRLQGPLISTANLLDVKSIREYSNLGMVIDDIDELIEPSDVVKIQDVINLNFDLLSLKVETKKGSKLGHVIDFTVNPDDFAVQQIIVKRPLIKSFADPELTIPRTEIVEITDYKIIVKDEEKTIKERAENEDFIPNFVNPFRNQENLTPAGDRSTKD
ncbi:hypothetical protein IKF28_02290 [Candidatus Saccharibacteria bacterium]|nr:hypothetical protein [Candidatus Saccharibacteria bacterium]MBR3122254.1 hypothetical protein [Candidatus Saccharibacteria bacterium]